MGLGVVFWDETFGALMVVRFGFFLFFWVISMKTRSMLEEFSGLGKNVEG